MIGAAGVGVNSEGALCGSAGLVVARVRTGPGGCPQAFPGVGLCCVKGGVFSEGFGLVFEVIANKVASEFVFRQTVEMGQGVGVEHNYSYVF